jgi:hypothetical protein
MLRSCGKLFRNRAAWRWFDRGFRAHVYSKKNCPSAPSSCEQLPNKIKRNGSEGRLAQLVRAPALQAGGRRFESCTAHHQFNNLGCSFSAIVDFSTKFSTKRAGSNNSTALRAA